MSADTVVGPTTGQSSRCTDTPRRNITIEAETPKGFADDLQRTVTENARTLKFDTHELETG